MLTALSYGKIGAFIPSTSQIKPLQPMSPQPPALGKTLSNIRETLIWVAPALGIPGLRYFQDSKEQRNELFIRDASTYSIGAMVYLVAFFGGRKLMQRYFPKLGAIAHDFLPFLAALTLNILYAGIGAVRFSKWMSQKPKTGPLPATSPFSGQGHIPPVMPFSPAPYRNPAYKPFAYSPHAMRYPFN